MHGFLALVVEGNFLPICISSDLSSGASGFSCLLAMIGDVGEGEVTWTSGRPTHFTLELAESFGDSFLAVDGFGVSSPCWFQIDLVWFRFFCMSYASYTLLPCCDFGERIVTSISRVRFGDSISYNALAFPAVS